VNNVGSLIEATSWAMFGRMNQVAQTQMATGIGPEVFTGSESFYRTALESLSEGVMILDAECRSIFVRTRGGVRFVPTLASSTIGNSPFGHG
jgi:hypothetical protein